MDRETLEVLLDTALTARENYEEAIRGVTTYIGYGFG